jgi:predicted metal-dependent enzyme (double-stranded beta helix superfamily)
MPIQEERNEEISKTVDRIRQMSGDGEIHPDILEGIKKELIALAAKKHLFSLEDFPPPEPSLKRRSCLYRLSEDTDHRFALYANAADGAVNAPPHDHTTWAVIVGVEGLEKNKFYNRAEKGVEQVGEGRVEEGSGVALMPDDLHSIHIEEGSPVLNFHMYGLGLEQLHKRNYWNKNKGIWEVFPAHTDIREART